jgi:Spx/MgsR family transcriptional regulator
MVILYGINNCDTVRKARRWLADHQVEYRFHDLRADGLTAALLDDWIAELGWEALLNRRGATWRQLPENQRATPEAATARRIMLTHPAIIRRPLIDTGSRRHVGFSDAQYTTLFG